MVSLQRKISASFPLLLVRGGAWLNTTPPMDKCDIYLVDKLHILRMKDDDMLPFNSIEGMATSCHEPRSIGL